MDNALLSVGGVVGDFASSTSNLLTTTSNAILGDGYGYQSVFDDLEFGVKHKLPWGLFGLAAGSILMRRRIDKNFSKHYGQSATEKIKAADPSFKSYYLY